MKYYPPLSQLIGREALPSDIGIFGAANEAIQDVLDSLLAGICFKDLIISQSAFGDAKFYSLTIVAQELGFKLPGTDISFLFFPGADGTGDANIPIAFEWRWTVKRYVNDFETALFSRSPQDFFDLLLKVANISDAQFVDGIVKTFIGDPDPYVKLVQDIRTLVSDYSKNTVTLDDADNEIRNNAAAILTSLDLLVTDLQDPAPAFDSALDYIAERFENIANTLDIDLDVCELAFETVTRDIQDAGQKLDNLLALFGSWFGGFDWERVEELLAPQFSLTVTQLPAALEFPRAWLVPLLASGDPDPDVTHKSRLTFNAGSITYSTQTGLTFTGENSFGFNKSMIGNTGLTLEIDDAKIDFSRTTNIPEADAEGYPVDFVGVFVKSIVIGLPQKWFSTPTGSPQATLAVVGRNLFIGTGGLNGTIGLEALAVGGRPDPNGPKLPAAGAEIEFILGNQPPSSGGTRQGFALGFSSFDMTFRQGALTATNIKGSMTIPKFQATPPEIDIALHIAQDGDFDMTATVPGTGYPLTLPGIFTFTVKSLSVGKDDKRVYIQTTGDLSFENNTLIGDFITQPIHIEKLRINSDGSFEIEGGTIPLPESVIIPLGPAKIAVTAIHCGAHEQDYNSVMRKYRYWGFDGGINVDPGGIDARGDGIRYYYTVDDDATHPPHHFLRIEGIGIDLVIPGNVPKDQAALLLQGYLSLKDPVYHGSLAFQLPQVKIAGNASMSYDTSYPAWIVEAGLELPTPLPLGATSLGIYSFSGLFGLRYVASKDAVSPPLALDASWGDYYRAPPIGVDVTKFQPPTKTAGASNPFSIGAGVGLSTIPDDTVFSAQLFLLVSIPNLILLEGRGDVLAEQRVGLNDDPPYYAYLALSPDSIEIGAGAHYMVPKSTGKVLDLNATLEAAFFFNNASAWYVNFGTKAKPMTARVVSLFDAYAYLMLSASGIEAGAGVSFDFSKQYGPVSVSAHAYLDLWAYLSFKRGQAGGGIALGGYVDVKVMGIGFHIEIATGLTVDAPTPFRVAGYVHVCVSVNLRIKKFQKCVDVAFVWQGDPNPDTSQIPVLPDLIATPLSPPFAAGVHMASGRSYAVQVSENTELALGAINARVPLDTYIDLKFLKPVDPSKVSIIGGYTNPSSANSELMPPKNGWKPVRHTYTLDALRLETWSSIKPGWITYQPFLALAQGALMSPADAALLGSLPIGTWQKQDTSYSQIRLLALTPFSYMEPVGGYRPEQMGLTAATLFCAGATRTETCVKFDMVAVGVAAAIPMKFTAGVDYYRGGLLFRIEGEDTTSVPVGTSVPAQVMLAIKPGSRAMLQFPQAVVRCRLAFISSAPSVTLRFQQRKPNTPASPVSLPVFVDVKTLVAAPNALTNPIVYDDPTMPIDRVIVEPPAPDNQAIAALQDKIARLIDAEPALRDLEALQQQLQEQQGKYCGGSLGGAAPPTGGECATYLYQVCWLTEEDWTFNQAIPGAAAVEGDFQTMRNAVEKTIAPIWRPNQTYRVVLTVTDTVNGAANPNTFYVYFQTVGALGFFDPPPAPSPLPPPSPPPPVLDDGRAEIPERFLKFYIDMERSDPDPSGNLLYAKPLYYAAPVLRLFFAKPYAYHFFAEWPQYHSPTDPPATAELDVDHYELVMRIKDPTESEPAPLAPDYAAPLLTAPLTGVQSWSADPAPRRTEDLKVLSNMRNPLLGGIDPGPTCWVVGGDPITPAAKALQVVLHDLEPNKLYTAVVINRHAVPAEEAEVHRYPFKTSIYPDFQSHIGSYQLTDADGNNRPAVFLVSHDLAAAATAPQTYAAARNVLQRIGAADADSAAYPDFFDRLIYACLKLAPLPPALSLEFNFMRNALTQGIYGLWIRSPEALNDPRIPLDQLRSAIRMYVGGSELLSPNVLFSKDCCQVFVMTAADAFPSQDVAFAFDHLTWDGQAYAAASTVSTDPFSAP